MCLQSIPRPYNENFSYCVQTFVDFELISSTNAWPLSVKSPHPTILTVELFKVHSSDLYLVYFELLTRDFRALIRSYW